MSVNKFEKLLIRNFLTSRPEGATFSEISEFLACNQIKLGLKKQIPSPHSVTCMFDDVIIRNSRLFLKDKYNLYVENMEKNRQAKRKVQSKNIDGGEPSSEYDFRDCDEKFTMKNSDHVNGRVQKKLKELMELNPEGIWCLDIPELYFEIHKSELNFRDFGYTSLIQLVLELPEIFRPYQDSHDWRLFDASQPESEKEIKFRKSLRKKRKDYIPQCLKLELSKMLGKFSNEIGINVDEIPSIYYNKYGKRLNPEIFGFEDLISLLKCLKGDILDLRKADKSLYVIPLKISQKNSFESEDNSHTLGEAVPPILPGEDLFFELFPLNVYGPTHNIPNLDLEKYLEVGSRIDIMVADVWTPHKFYVQLEEFGKKLVGLSDNLQNFYISKPNKYHMPEVTIQPNQICALPYEDIWYRAQIVKIFHKEKISVRLIDCGRVIYVNSSQLRFLPKKFGDIPRLAIPAALANIEPNNAEKRWGASTNERFLELVGRPTMLMEVIHVDYKEPRVVIKMWDTSEKKKINVSKTLIKEGLAIFSESIYQHCKMKTSRSTTNQKKAERPEIIPPTESEAESQISEIVQSTKDEAEPQIDEIIQPTRSEAESQNSVTFEKIKLDDYLMQYAQMQEQAYQQQLVIQNLQAAVDERMQLNNLTLYYFNHNEEIRNIAKVDPEMGLRLAKSLAEDYIKNVTKAAINLQNLAAAAAATSVDINDLSQKVLPLNISGDSTKDQVREIDIEGRKVHIVTIKGERFACADQIVVHFTAFSTFSHLDKILKSKKIKINYEIITRSENEEIFEDLESYNSYKLGQSIEEEILFLLPLKEVPLFLKSANMRKESVMTAFMNLLES